jgi:hypothetical protein
MPRIFTTFRQQARGFNEKEFWKSCGEFQAKNTIIMSSSSL